MKAQEKDFRATRNDFKWKFQEQIIALRDCKSSPEANRLTELPPEMIEMIVDALIVLEGAPSSVSGHVQQQLRYSRGEESE